MPWDEDHVAEDSLNEDPASADIEALDFSGAFCPHCGEEVWEEADQCPECGEWITAPRSDPAGTRASRKRLYGAILVTSFLLVVFIWIFLSGI